MVSCKLCVLAFLIIGISSASAMTDEEYQLYKLSALQDPDYVAFVAKSRSEEEANRNYHFHHDRCENGLKILGKCYKNEKEPKVVRTQFNSLNVEYHKQLDKNFK